MLIQATIGNLLNYDTAGKTIDRLPLEWYEASKRILRKQTKAGKDISLKFLNDNPQHAEGDILFVDETSIIAITILPCDCIVVLPKNMFEMASVCYEIGNKHLPLFYEAESLLIPLDMPLLRLLSAQGYEVKEERRKLLQPLKTTVSPHGTAGNGTLFSKIMKLSGQSPPPLKGD